MSMDDSFILLSSVCDAMAYGIYLRPCICTMFSLQSTATCSYFINANMWEANDDIVEHFNGSRSNVQGRKLFNVHEKSMRFDWPYSGWHGRQPFSAQLVDNIKCIQHKINSI